ncbi:hypothetical protein [Xanthobacter versatilis]|uniref:hypothetical protein n=1 Tax=Xanthobacter autotrophicus (strain ATCC BAA-1158 / Py2) TaxID=78245 RepID=UPI0037269C05
MGAYLDPVADASAYGLPAGTTAGQVAYASRLIDEYLRRPEGLVWKPDYAGRPAYMDGLTPTNTFTTSSAISPGLNVVVPVSNLYKTTTILGEVLILDRAGQCEACVVTAVDTATVTLDKVERPHSSGTTLELGLVLMEERQMPAKRSVTRVSRPNFVRLLALQGRYGYGRRSDQMSGTYNEVNLLATLSSFGGPPQWVPVDIAQVDASSVTGELWVPAGMMLAYYTDVRARYIAGFPVGGLPEPIKTACAQIVISQSATAGIPTTVGSLRAGDTEIRRFGSAGGNDGPRRAGSGVTDLSSDVKGMLDPYRVRSTF